MGLPIACRSAGHRSGHPGPPRWYGFTSVSYRGPIKSSFSSGNPRPRRSPALRSP
jgi:hypothetical protein